MPPASSTSSSPPSGADPDQAVVAALAQGDRRALARAITLIESSRADHRAQAEDLLAKILPRAGTAVRIGISGPPGVGKSTFIEAFGLHLIGQGHRVAVLAVDPSSPRSGGSILGDKTRMPELSVSPAAFIRPSPAGGTLGGVARRTREAMLACEAAGFDVVIVETVGVGQSETAVADMVDLFVLILPPAGGDELQGLKKGIVELADLLLVNKADGELKPAASRAVAEYSAALHMLRPPTTAWLPPVLPVSALQRHGMAEVWDAIGKYRAVLGPAGLAQRRAGQAKAWMWSEIEENILSDLRRHPRVEAGLKDLENKVLQGLTTPGAAALQVLAWARDGR